MALVIIAFYSLTYLTPLWPFFHMMVLYLAITLTLIYPDGGLVSSFKALVYSRNDLLSSSISCLAPDTVDMI